MPTLIILTFLFLILTFCSLWLKKTPKVWGTLLLLSLGCAFFSHLVSLWGLSLLAFFFLLWIYYYYQQNFLLFVALVCFGMGFKLHFFSGYSSYSLTGLFSLAVETPLIGLFPLALLVPLMRHLSDIPPFFKGLLLGIGGIVVLALLATLSGAVSFDLKIPSFLGLRAANNFFLVSIPEEGFYRGFIQRTLAKKWGNGLSLFVTTALFTAAHIYWSPSLDILVFVFLAGLLYGTVYLVSKNIESAICTHFLLNMTHMLFFSYHAL